MRSESEIWVFCQELLLGEVFIMPPPPSKRGGGGVSLMGLLVYFAGDIT
jgi:hypothetical protein